MSTLSIAFVRSIVASAVVSAVLLGNPSDASAQGFGVGGRFAWVTADSDADADSVRFTGGQIRLVSSRWGLEVSLDRHTESFEALNEKVIETPIQTSLLLRLGSGSVSPFLLAGPGWYKRTVEPIDGPDESDLDVKSTEFGWHAGGGLEIIIARHLGIHGDYRYTFLDFGDDDDEDEDDGLIGSVLPGHRGSMWTLGATIYF
jgi:opacity protein-like surface antigen